MGSLHIILVAAALVAVGRTQLVDESQLCEGGILELVSYQYDTRVIDISSLPMRLTKLIVTDCITRGPIISLHPRQLNITFILTGGYGQFFLSGTKDVKWKTYIQYGNKPIHIYGGSEVAVNDIELDDDNVTISFVNTDYIMGEAVDMEFYIAWPPATSCDEPLTQCYNQHQRHMYCLPKQWVCNGRQECETGLDESDCQGCCKQAERVSTCSTSNKCYCDRSDDSDVDVIDGCNGQSKIIPMASLTYSGGVVALPQFPRQVIPYNVTYMWQPPTYEVNLTITFHAFNRSAGDTLEFRKGDGKLVHFSLSDLGIAKRIHLYPHNTSSLNIVMKSPNSRYNFSYEFSQAVTVPMGSAPCDELYIRSCLYKDHCYIPSQHCNNIMDCPNGRDELGCMATKENGNACSKDEIACPHEKSKRRCFKLNQRCDGNDQCTSRYDELNCDATLCGPQNGTFLCPDKSCIFETWLCDKTDDCVGGADEQNCNETSLKVVTASVIGSLVCAIMIVIAVGCSCKLHTHRLYESIHNRSRYESPMTMIQNELMRRAAPPPYAEAMQRSRPFDEVQSEYLAALEQRRGEEGQRGQEGEDNADEGRSVASASGALDGNDSSLVEVGDENSVSYRRNPNKPPESSTDTNPDNIQPLLPDLMDNTAVVTLEPKSDDEQEGGDGDGDSPPSASDSPQTTNANMSRRQVLRRSSVDSDASLLSRDSDDVPLLN